MVKGVAGEVESPFNRLFRQRAEKAGLIGIQQQLLDRFRAAGAMVVYTLVAYQPGLPGVTPNSPLFGTLIDNPTLLQNTSATEVMDEVAPQPKDPVLGRCFDQGLGARCWAYCASHEVEGLTSVVAGRVAVGSAFESLGAAISGDTRRGAVLGAERDEEPPAHPRDYGAVGVPADPSTTSTCARS